MRTRFFEYPLAVRRKGTIPHVDRPDRPVQVGDHLHLKMLRDLDSSIARRHNWDVGLQCKLPGAGSVAE